MGFQHQEQLAYDHPFLFINSEGRIRPSVALLKKATEAVSRPFVDFFLRELRTRLQAAISDEEYIFLNHILHLGEDGRQIIGHELELCLAHDAPEKSECAPIARINLDEPRITWLHMDPFSHSHHNLVVWEIAKDPIDFQDTLERAIQEMIQPSPEIPVLP